MTETLMDESFYCGPANIRNVRDRKRKRKRKRKRHGDTWIERHEGIKNQS
jgi:hypothetical protein